MNQQFLAQLAKNPNAMPSSLLVPGTNTGGANRSRSRSRSKNRSRSRNKTTTATEENHEEEKKATGPALETFVAMPPIPVDPNRKKAVLTTQTTFEVRMDNYAASTDQQERYLAKIDHKIARTDQRSEVAHAAADQQVSLNAGTFDQLNDPEDEAA